MNKNKIYKINQQLEKDFASLSLDEKLRFNKLFYVYNTFSSFFHKKVFHSNDDLEVYFLLVPEAKNFPKEFFYKNLKYIKESSITRFSLYNIYIPYKYFKKIDEKTVRVSIMKNDEFDVRFENNLNDDVAGFSISYLNNQHKIQFTTWVLDEK